jgi:hypothetical protein
MRKEIRVREMEEAMGGEAMEMGPCRCYKQGGPVNIYFPCALQLKRPLNGSPGVKGSLTGW